MKFEQEALAHQETVAKFKMDRTILVSTESANMEALRGTEDLEDNRLS